MNKTFIMSYDIASNATRRQVLRLMRKLSAGYQYSVFEIEGDEQQVSHLLKQVAPLLAPETDRLLLLGGKVFTRKWQLGCGLAHQPNSPFLVII